MSGGIYRELHAARNVLYTATSMAVETDHPITVYERHKVPYHTVYSWKQGRKNKESEKKPLQIK